MYEFITIVMIVFGILQIILFFKIWGMTDNIAEIKSKYIDTYSTASIKDLLYLGRRDEAAAIVVAQLVDQLKKDIAQSYESKDERREKMANSIKEAKSRLAYFDKLDALPKHLENIDNFVEYYNKVLYQFK